jgi:heme exporter protein C
MATRSGVGAGLLLAATTVAFACLIANIFLVTPAAQAAAGGLAQKIFYFHVPAAYAMYLSGVVCLAASAAYLVRETDHRDAVAHASAECAVLFGALVLISGPLWAKRAWGVYWTWEPRLVTSLLAWLIYASNVIMRRVLGNGQAESRVAAALGVVGAFILPLIHLSVQKWRGAHPTVIGKGGGGLSEPTMWLTLLGGFVAMTLLAALLIWTRARLHSLRARLDRLERRALTANLMREA